MRQNPMIYPTFRQHQISNIMLEYYIDTSINELKDVFGEHTMQYHIRLLTDSNSSYTSIEACLSLSAHVYSV